MNRDEVLERIVRLEERQTAIGRIIVALSIVTFGLLVWAIRGGFDLGGLANAVGV